MVIFDINGRDNILDTIESCRSHGRKPSLRYICGEIGWTEPNYPVPATMKNVDTYWRQYWRTSNMGEYRMQYG